MNLSEKTPSHLRNERSTLYRCLNRVCRYSLYVLGGGIDHDLKFISVCSYFRTTDSTSKLPLSSAITIFAKGPSKCGNSESNVCSKRSNRPQEVRATV